MSVTSAKRKIGEIKENTVVAILGAQQAPRMKNFGSKSNILLPNNQTLLQHQIDVINRTWGPSEILISIGYDADKVISKRPNARLIENTKWDETGEVEELRLILNCCNPDRFIIFPGDLFVSNFSFTLPQESYSLSLNYDDFNQIGVKTEDGFLDMFSFSFNSKFLGLANLQRNELQLLRKFITRERSKFALWELLDDYLKAGLKLKNIELNTSKIVKLSTAKDLSLIRNSFGVL